MRFYTNVSLNEKTNQFHIKGYEDGKRFNTTLACEPYCFIPTQEPSKLKTLEGIAVKKKTFPSQKKFKAFLEEYGSISNAKVFGLGHREFELVHCLINDLYPEDIKALR